MITVVLPKRAEECVALTVSPLLECVLSLHVLVDPKHHALQHDWVRRMRSLDPELRSEADVFAFLFRHQIPDAFLPSGHDAESTFADDVARFRRLSPELLLDALGRPLYDHGGNGASVFDDPKVVAVALDRAGAAGTRSRQAAHDMFDDPAAFGDRFAGFLERYWHASFADEWQRVEERLARSISDSGHELASAGALSVLGRLPAHCRVSAALEQLEIDLPHEHRVEITADAPLVLSPSYFVWPHLRVSCDSPWPIAIVYTGSEFAREAAPRIPEADLLQALRAIADDTRLRVLTLIAERPRTTQELAPLVGLSRAGLSKSLQRLAEAGLVVSRREGYYVVYSLARDRVDALAAALGRLVGGQ